MSEDEEVTLPLEIKQETDSAMLVSDGDIEAWLPLSLAIAEPWTSPERRVVDVTMPEWLALDRGLI